MLNFPTSLNCFSTTWRKHRNCTFFTLIISNIITGISKKLLKGSESYLQVDYYNVFKMTALQAQTHTSRSSFVPFNCHNRRDG